MEKKIVKINETKLSNIIKRMIKESELESEYDDEDDDEDDVRPKNSALFDKLEMECFDLLGKADRSISRDEREQLADSIVDHIRYNWDLNVEYNKEGIRWK